MNYYEILNLKKDATKSEIKKAYYKLAQKYHPDKVSENDREEATKKFQEIGEAYEVLSDPEKRKIYDVSGKEGLDSGFSGFSENPFDIFSRFFGGNGFPTNFPTNFSNNFSNSFSRTRKRKNKETIFNLNISLKDVFLGKKKKLKITKKVVVNKETKETISEDLEKTWKDCSPCQGQGATVEMRQVGHSMFTQSQKICSICQGKGSIFYPEFEIQEITEIIEIDIPKNADNKNSVRIPEAGNVTPGSYPGDLLVVLYINNQENGFTRKGNDLYYEKQIYLYEALAGSSFKIKHLDDRSLYISFESVIPGEVKKIPGEGLNGHNLIISFEILFPDKLTKEIKTKLKSLLPTPSEKNTKKEKDIIYQV